MTAPSERVMIHESLCRQAPTIIMTQFDFGYIKVQVPGVATWSFAPVSDPSSTTVPSETYTPTPTHTLFTRSQSFPIKRRLRREQMRIMSVPFTPYTQITRSL